MWSVKFGIQRLFRGYSDGDLWNLSDHLGKVIAIRLRAFRKMKKNGFPTDLDNVFDDPKKKTRTLNDKNGMRKWNEVLDEMAWVFENYNKDDKYYHHHGDMKWGEPDENGNCRLLDSGVTADKKKLKKHWHRVNDGLKLFADNFLKLWD